MFKLVCLLFLLLSFPASAINIEDKLAQVNYFSLGYNGFVAKKSEGELLYEKLLPEKNSEEVFFKLLQSDQSTNESKLYAACGLWLLNKDRLEEIRPEKGFVTVLQGDILRREDYVEYFSRIKKRGCVR